MFIEIKIIIRGASLGSPVVKTLGSVQGRAGVPVQELDPALRTIKSRMLQRRPKLRQKCEKVLSVL